MMTRRTLLQAAVFSTLAVVSPVVSWAADPAPKRPNVIFLLTDDQGYGDAAAFGHPYAKTPNFDRLIKEGKTFKQFYVVSPVCSSSRTGFITAQYPARLGMHAHLGGVEENQRRGMPDFLDPNVTTVMDAFKKAGYVTGHYGKWHLGDGDKAPEAKEYGIDEARLAATSAAPKFNPDGAAPDRQVSHTITRRSIDESIDFIARNKDKPFYLNIWTTLPHAPLAPTAEMRAPYKDVTYDPLNAAFGKWQQEYLGTIKKFKTQMDVYHASLTDLDGHVGRLLDALDKQGLAQNTIIVFSSDNGPEDQQAAQNAGTGSPGVLRGRKRSLYEGGIRVPFVVRWPEKIKPGTVDEKSVIAAVDFFPTVCTLAGVPLPAEVKSDGEDMSDAIVGEPRARKKPVYWEWLFIVFGEQFTPPPLVMREGDYKLLMDAGQKRVELYNIPADPEERTNLAAKHPEIVEKMAPQLLAWRNSLPDAKARSEKILPKSRK